MKLCIIGTTIVFGRTREVKCRGKVRAHFIGWIHKEKQECGWRMKKKEMNCYLTNQCVWYGQYNSMLLNKRAQLNDYICRSLIISSTRNTTEISDMIALNYPMVKNDHKHRPLYTEMLDVVTSSYAALAYKIGNYWIRRKSALAKQINQIITGNNELTKPAVFKITVEETAWIEKHHAFHRTCDL